LSGETARAYFSKRFLRSLRKKIAAAVISERSGGGVLGLTQSKPRPFHLHPKGG